MIQPEQEIGDFPIALIDRVEPGTLGPEEALTSQYREYLNIRIRFLLDRFRRFPDFPGVHTGYDSITGEEFSEEHLYSYSWINGRGACVCARFAGRFPAYHDELMAFSLHAIRTMEHHRRTNAGRFPFMADRNGIEQAASGHRPRDSRSYSDLYACFGFLEYGVRAGDRERIDTAEEVFAQIISALRERRFVSEPDPIEGDLLFENPWSVALDLANECAKQLNAPSYLDTGAQLVQYLLDAHYLGDLGAFVEYATRAGEPSADESGRYIVDPGHAIELAAFALEFSRLAQKNDTHAALRQRIDRICPDLILWNVAKGWNPNHPGLFKTIDAVTEVAVNDTMPWWILPEAMLALLLAYESRRDGVFLERFRDAHNAYFGNYMNSRTAWGPIQNRDGGTGEPVDIPPACKFQDPEFHSGKNLLTVIDTMERIACI